MLYITSLHCTSQLHASAGSAGGRRSCEPVCNDVSAARGKTANVRLQYALGVRTAPVTTVTVLLTLIDHMTEPTAAHSKEKDTEKDSKT